MRAWSPRRAYYIWFDTCDFHIIARFNNRTMNCTIDNIYINIWSYTKHFTCWSFNLLPIVFVCHNNSLMRSNRTNQAHIHVKHNILRGKNVFAVTALLLLLLIICGDISGTVKCMQRKWLKMQTETSTDMTCFSYI